MNDAGLHLPETAAALDLGSNSFHMIVARQVAGELVVVDRLKEMVRLAAGLGTDRRINGEAQVRALDCLRRFGQRIQHMPPEAVRAVGTNTLRSAHDSRGFLLAAEEALGHSIETISGIEEARLIYDGVSHNLPEPVGRRLVIDIGGGSTELIVGEDFKPLDMESLYVGCVSLSRRWFPGGEITEDGWRGAKLAVLQELETVEQRFRALGWQRVVGSSGTVRAVGAVIREAGWSENGITRKALDELGSALLAAGHVDRLQLAGLSKRRTPVFPGGVALLSAAFEALELERVEAVDGALREGLLYDLLGRFREEDARSRSVAALIDRYHVDREQAARVEATARAFLRQVTEAWTLPPKRSRQLLSWAARLHECGLDIAHQHYHRHGQYIIAESDLSGFSREEQNQLAGLVLAHRRKFPREPLRSLRQARERRVEQLAVVLRLAVLLRRSRTSVPLPRINLHPAQRSLALEFPAGWLESHPLTQADLAQEAAYLRAAEIDLRFS